MKSISGILVILLIGSLLLACVFSTAAPATPTSAGIVETLVAQTLAAIKVDTPTSTPEAPFPSPTFTLTPEASAAPCNPKAIGIADVTIPDDTPLAPSTPFLKTWRMRNSGACPWEVGTKLVFVSGELMSGPAAVDVPAVAPGAETDISVPLVAPSTPGTYRGQWQLQTPGGVRFGPIIWVQIIVPAPVLPSDTPVLIADLHPFNISLQDWTPSVGQDVIVELTLRNEGNAPVADFIIRLLQQSPGKSCPGAGTVLFDDHTSLEANGSQVFRRTIHFTTAGTYQLCVVLDHLNFVPESNEDNNALRSNQNVTVNP